MDKYVIITKNAVFILPDNNNDHRIIVDDSSIIIDTLKLYRAVGADEFSSIIRSRAFSVLEYGLHVKHFGVCFKETLDFANRDFNVDVVAIFEIEISKNILMSIGDFTHVDPYIFKSGTVEIRADNLNEFNAAVLKIIHIC